MTPLLELQKNLSDLNVSVMDLYKQYSPLEGATGQIVYSVPWDDLVQAYQAANPNVQLSWQKLPLQEASFFASVRSNTLGDTSLPAVLWSRIPGSSITGPSGGPDGQVTLGASSSEASGNNIADVAIGFGNSVSGQLALSLNGACPLLNGGQGASVSIDSERFATFLVGNLAYTYEIAARRGYTARYNVSNLVTRMERSTKRGGWFSASSANEIVEDNDSRDWFEIAFDADAAEFQYSPQEQSEISKDVKAGLLDRSLKNMAAINGLNSNPPPLPAMPEATGVGAAALALRRNCFWNYYCMGSAFILSTADNIFGSKTATSHFKRANSVWVEDRVRGIHILGRTGGLTFRPVGEMR